MSMADAIAVFHGGCHCGQLAVEFSTSQDPAAINPRACDCSFCSKHGASYISDPAGKLSVSVNSAGSLREYQQGTNTARFLLCNQCGVLVAVIYRHDSYLRRCKCRLLKRADWTRQFNASFTSAIAPRGEDIQVVESVGAGCHADKY
jgi:hypothetical protein